MPPQMSTLTTLQSQLPLNPNPPALQQLIQEVTKQIESRVYWLNVADDDGTFMKQYWDHHVHVSEVMKARIGRIVEEKFEEMWGEVGGRGDRADKGDKRVGVLELGLWVQDVPIYDSEYFRQDHPKTRETQAKIREIKEEERKFRDKIEQLKRKEEQRKREKEQMDEQIRRSLEKEKKEKYKQYVSRTIEQKQRAQTQRKLQHEKFNQFLKTYKTTKPLHILMQQQYKQKVQLPILQQNRKKLEQYRQRQKQKPTLQQINEHQQSYLEYKSGRQSRIVIANKTIDVSFKSKFYLEEQKKFNGGEEGYETLFDQVERKKRYSEMIKQEFKPRVSEQLRESIASQMQHSTAKESLDRAALIERGKKYLQFMRSLEKNRKQHSSPNEDTNAGQKQSPRYIDYLQDLRQSRGLQGSESRVSSGWQRDMRNKSLTDYERRERILMKSRQLEEKAQRREQIINSNNYHKPEEIIQGKREIDQALISSIRAKVAVLKDAHQARK